MNQKQSLSFLLEAVWWIVTLLVVGVVLYPIYSKAGATYPFFKGNILFIVVFITFTRLIFLLKHTFLANMEKVKLAIILFSAIIVFLLVNQLNLFQTYLDENGPDSFLGHLPIIEQSNLDGYIRKEMLFFGVGSIIAAILLPFRMLISIWKGRNR